jgi:branched-chain amino acid transport system permease protein
MMLYLQNATSGLAAGVTYGLVALALVIVFRATGVVNFAAGEMATFTTFIAWELIVPAGLPFFVTMVIVAAIAALLGVVVYLLVIHPARRRPEFVTVMITFGLYELFNGLSNSLWDPSPRTFPAPVSGPPLHIGSVIVTRANLGDAAVAIVAMLLLAGLFRFTRVGLGLRATADNPVAARIVGITPARMYALGWAMASVAGAIAGMLFANVLLLSPTMMGNVLVFSLVSVIVGGLESPVGAIVGGLVIGVVAGVLAGVHGVGPNLATPVMLGLVIVVLLLRPQGLFGRVVARKL